MKRPHVLAAILLLACVYLGVSLTWCLHSLGEISLYADSHEYLALARRMEGVDQYRGAVYPAFLATLARVFGDAHAPAAVQIVQLLLHAAALAYFLHVVLGPTGGLRSSGGRGRVACGLLLLLLLFDPVPAHFDLSIMPDSLALSASLLFCAALADLGVGASRRRTAVLLLFAAAFVAAGTRPEKGVVLLTTGIASVACWTLVRRRLGPCWVPTRAASVTALVTVVSALVAAAMLQYSVHRDRGRWPLLTTALHHRVIYPHLSSIHAGLPAELRRRISPQQARVYDIRINNTWRVIDEATGRDAQIRERVTRELAAEAWRRRWPTITADVLSDLFENTFPILGFHPRLAVWLARGGSDRAYLLFYEPVPRIYDAMSRNHSRIAPIVLALSGGFLTLAAVLAGVAAVRGHWRRMLPERWVVLVPAGIFCIANAVPFALVADLVEPRYTLFAYTFGLFAIYTAAAGVLPPFPRGSGGPPAPAEGSGTSDREDRAAGRGDGSA